MLETAQREHEYRRQGYVVIDRLFDEHDLARACAESDRFHDLARGLRASTPEFNLEAPGGGFSSQSGDAEAFDGVLRKVNRLVELSPFVAEVSRRPGIVELAQALTGSASVTLDNSILWCKPPKLGSAKPLHQDAPWLQAPHDRYVTIWIAIDRCSQANGCMEFVPGSHAEGLLSYGGQEKLVEAAPYAAQLTPCPLEPGAAVAFHAYALHASAHNASDSPRRSVMLRYRGLGEEPEGRPRR